MSLRLQRYSHAVTSGLGRATTTGDYRTQTSDMPLLHSEAYGTEQTSVVYKNPNSNTEAHTYSPDDTANTRAVSRLILKLASQNAK